MKIWKYFHVLNFSAKLCFLFSFYVFGFSFFFSLLFSLSLSLWSLFSPWQSLSLYMWKVTGEVWSLETNGGVCCCNDQNVLVFYVFCFFFFFLMYGHIRYFFFFIIFYLFISNKHETCMSILFCVCTVCPYLVGWMRVWFPNK